MQHYKKYFLLLNINLPRIFLDRRSSFCSRFTVRCILETKSFNLMRGPLDVEYAFSRKLLKMSLHGKKCDFGFVHRP